jgi:hypothetical protein
LSSVLYTDFTNARANLNDSTTFGGNTIPAGATIAIGIVSVSGSGTFAISDTLNGAYTQSFHTTYGASESIDLWTFRGSAAGTLTVNLTLTGTATYYVTWLVITGADTSASITSDTISEGALNNHNCAATGLTGAGLFLGLAGLGTSTAWTPGSGWSTENDTTSAGAILQRKIETGTLEQGPYTTTVSTNSAGVLLFIPDSGAPPPPSSVPFFTQLGAKRI